MSSNHFPSHEGTQPSSPLSRSKSSIPRSAIGQSFIKGVEAVPTEEPAPPSQQTIDETKAPDSSSDTHSLHGAKRQHLAGLSRKLAGRPHKQIVHTRSAAPEPMSSISSHDPHSSDTDSTLGNESQEKPSRKHHHVRHHPHLPHHSKRAIISQVTEWLHQEKTRQAARKSARKPHRTSKHPELKTPVYALAPDDTKTGDTSSRRSSSDLSESSLALRKLERILTTSSISSIKDAFGGQETDSSKHLRRHHRSRKNSLLLGKKNSYGAASESDAKDALHIPSAEVVLDNSKVCSISERRNSVSEGATVIFKREIVRLTHTLGIPGWRHVRMEDGDRIEVSRLSGALTNAVYVVKPPPEVSEQDSSGPNASSTSLTSKRRRPR